MPSTHAPVVEQEPETKAPAAAAETAPKPNEPERGVEEEVEHSKTEVSGANDE